MQFTASVNVPAGANITRFDSTMIVPIDPTPGSGWLFVWPGLQPANNGVVLQTVAGSENTNTLFTYKSVFYCCTPDYEYPSLHMDRILYTGDEMTSNFTKVADLWTISAAMQPGSQGIAAGSVPFVETQVFNPAIYPEQGPFTNALFDIEPQGNRIWDFGSLTFKNIRIESTSPRTDWCKIMNWNGNSVISIASTTPTPYVFPSGSGCVIAELTLSPAPKTQALADGQGGSAVPRSSSGGNKKRVGVMGWWILGLLVLGISA